MSIEQLYKNKHPWLLHIKTKCLPEYKKIKNNQLKQINPKVNPNTPVQIQNRNSINSVGTSKNYKKLISLGFKEKIIKTVLAKMKKSTKHTADHYNKKSGLLKKQFK